MKKTSRGVIHFLPLLVVALLLIFGVGYYAYSTGQVKLTETAVAPSLSNPPQDYSTDNWKTYTNEKYGYSIKYPDNWKLTEVDDPGLGDGPLMYTTIVPPEGKNYIYGINIAIKRDNDWQKYRQEARQHKYIDYNFNGIPALIFDDEKFDERQISLESLATNNIIIITYWYGSDIYKPLIDQILSTLQFLE